MAKPQEAKGLADKEFAAVLLEAAAAEGSQPPEDEAEYAQWFEKVTNRLLQQAIEEGYMQGKNEDGTLWCMISPTPHFVVKTKNKVSKVFINICSSDKIREPQPIGDLADGTQDIQWRVPLSCGTARLDKDKEGMPCIVYDIIYNTGTLERAAKEPDFKQLIIALGLEYLKQKSEPDLSGRWTLPKMKCKGSPELQRVRLDAPATTEHTLGDSNIRLPEGELSATRTAARHGGPLITEIDTPQSHPVPLTSPSYESCPEPVSTPKPSLSTIPPLKHQGSVDYQPKHMFSEEPSTIPAVTLPAAPNTESSATSCAAPEVASPVECNGNSNVMLQPPILECSDPDDGLPTQLEHHLECQGKFDWESHGLAIPDSDNSPKEMVLQVHLPETLVMKDIETDIQAWTVQLTHHTTRQRLLMVRLPFMANEEQSAGKFFKKRHLLQITLPVDAIGQSHLKAQQLEKELLHVQQLEAEGAMEAEKAKALHMKRLDEHERALQQEREEAETRRQREIQAAREAREQEQLRKAKGEEALRYAQQSAERATETRRQAMEKMRGSCTKEAEEPPGQDTLKGKFESTTYGNTPKRMKDLFGVEFKNRYLFALDSDM